MQSEKPDAPSAATQRTDQKRDRQSEPIAPDGVLQNRSGNLDRATAEGVSRGTTERLVKLLGPDNMGHDLTKQGSVDLTAGMKSAVKEMRATQSQPAADNSEKAGAANAQHTNQTPVAAGASQPDTPTASTPADKPQANAQHAELASSAPRHQPQQTDTTQAPKPEKQTPAATGTNQPDTPSATVATDKPVGSIATAPSEATAPIAPAQTASQTSGPEYTRPSTSVPQALPSTETASPLAVTSADTRSPESATQGPSPHEQKATSTPSGTQQAGGPSLAELLETLDKEWRQDIATSANDSAARLGPDTQRGAQPEVVRQYVDSITALLQSPPTPFTANNGHPAAVAESARREAFDREVTERLKRVLAAGPNAASRLSQADITAIHAESLRRELVNNGVLAPNEDLPDASQLA